MMEFNKLKEKIVRETIRDDDEKMTIFFTDNSVLQGYEYSSKNIVSNATLIEVITNDTNSFITLKFSNGVITSLFPPFFAMIII